MLTKKIFIYATTYLCCMFLLPACEKPDNLNQKVTSDQPIPISPRGEWCDDCPNDECCCVILLDESTTNSATIQICGTSSGTSGSCPAPSGCLGTSWPGCCLMNITLTSANPVFPRQKFCMGESQGFWIRNTGATAIDLLVTCRALDAPANYIPLHLEPGARVNWKTDGACELEPCQ